MAALGHKVTVYCRETEKVNTEREYKGVKLIYLPSFHLKSLETISHSLLAGFHAAFLHRGCTVVHMYNAASSFGGLFVKLSGKRLVMTLDGIEWERENWGSLAKFVWKVATWLSVKISDKVICDSRFVGDYFQSLYQVDIRYIPYGAKMIDKAIPLNKSFGLEKGRYLIFIGRFVKEKGVDRLIEAYNHISTDVPLVLIGDNENDPEYVNNLKKRSCSNVLFFGYRYGDEYESLLANAMAYVSASMLEGTSPSLLAAMGAKVCCLVNGIAENRETGAESVLYFDGTVEDLTQKIRCLISDDLLVEEYAKKGYERVRELYNWDVVTSSYVEAYSFS